MHILAAKLEFGSEGKIERKDERNVGWAELAKPNISISPIAKTTKAEHAHLKSWFAMQDGHVGLRKLSQAWPGPTDRARES